MLNRHHERKVEFAIDDGDLVRTVTFPDGKEYVQRCKPEVYQEVAYLIEELGSAGVTLDELAARLDGRHTQINVAKGFLLERACLEVRRRRNFATSNTFFEDAMCEFHALGQ